MEKWRLEKENGWRNETAGCTPGSPRNGKIEFAKIGERAVALSLMGAIVSPIEKRWAKARSLTVYLVVQLQGRSLAWLKTGLFTSRALHQPTLRSQAPIRLSA
jgi:hypothetical protein